MGEGMQKNAVFIFFGKMLSQVEPCAGAKVLIGISWGLRGLRGFEVKVALPWRTVTHRREAPQVDIRCSKQNGISTVKGIIHLCISSHMSARFSDGELIKSIIPLILCNAPIS